MNIIQKIKESVENATGYPFIYDSPQTLNLRIDSIPLPCAMLDVVESGVVVDDNGVMRERMQIQVLFCAKSDLDFDGLLNEQHRLDGLKKKAYKWLLSLRGSEHIRLVAIGNTQRYYATQDAIITAFGVAATIEELEGVCYDGRRRKGWCNCDTVTSA